MPLSKPAESSVTPLGSEPVKLNVGNGVPVAVTLNEPALPTVNAVLFALEMLGACDTSNVPPALADAMVGLHPAPVFEAVTVNGKEPAGVAAVVFTVSDELPAPWLGT